MTIKDSLQVRIAIVKAFLTRNFVPSRIASKFSFLGKMGKWVRNVKFCLRGPEKDHVCAKRFWRTDRKNQCMGLGSIEKNLKNLPPVLRPQRLSSRVTLTCLPSRQRRGRGAKTPYQIVTKFCTEVIHAKFDDHRFGVSGTLGVKFHNFHWI